METNKVNTYKRDLLQALKVSLGIVSHACNMVGISRTTYYEYLNNDKNFKAEVDNISDDALDFVETKLFEKIKDGDTTSIIFYLKTKGKNRGYSQHSINDSSELMRNAKLPSWMIED